MFKQWFTTAIIFPPVYLSIPSLLPMFWPFHEIIRGQLVDLMITSRDVPSFFPLPVPCDNQNTRAVSKAAHPLTELLSAGRSVDASCDFPRCWCFHCVGSNERLCWSTYTSCVCNNHTCIFTLFSACFFFPGCEKERDFMGVSKCPLPSTPPPQFSQNNKMNTRILNEGSGLKCMQVCAFEEL